MGEIKAVHCFKGACTRFFRSINKYYEEILPEVTKKRLNHFTLQIKDKDLAKVYRNRVTAGFD
jgi:predicted metalloenzyme YecM